MRYCLLCSWSHYSAQRSQTNRNNNIGSKTTYPRWGYSNGIWRICQPHRSSWFCGRPCHSIDDLTSNRILACSKRRIDIHNRYIFCTWLCSSVSCNESCISFYLQKELNGSINKGAELCCKCTEILSLLGHRLQRLLCSPASIRLT